MAKKVDRSFVVRSYRYVRHYQQDARALEAEGYRVMNISEQLETYPWWKVIATAGLVYLFAPRHVELVVVYAQRAPYAPYAQQRPSGQPGYYRPHA